MLRTTVLCICSYPNIIYCLRERALKLAAYWLLAPVLESAWDCVHLLCFSNSMLSLHGDEGFKTTSHRQHPGNLWIRKSGESSLIVLTSHLNSLMISKALSKTLHLGNNPVYKLVSFSTAVKNICSNKMSRETEKASQLVHKSLFVPDCHVW